MDPEVEATKRQHHSAVRPELPFVDDLVGGVQRTKLEGAVAEVESDGGGRNRGWSLLHRFSECVFFFTSELTAADEGPARSSYLNQHTAHSRERLTNQCHKVVERIRLTDESLDIRLQ